MHEKYCEWCGSVLLENSRCPVEDCVQNVLLDALHDALHDAEQEEGKKDDNSNA